MLTICLIIYVDYEHIFLDWNTSFRTKISHYQICNGLFLKGGIIIRRFDRHFIEKLVGFTWVPILLFLGVST